MSTRPAWEVSVRRASVRESIASVIQEIRWPFKGYGTAARLCKAAVLALAPLAVPAAAPADGITVAALGDSLTAGYGLPPGDGFVPQLQAWLGARGHDAVVLNAGVSGDTTAGGLARVAWTLTPEVDAMIVALGGNDLLRGIPPETARANLDGILAAADAAGVPVLLAGLTAPGNYGPDYKAAFESIYPDLAAEHDAIHVDSFVAGVEDALSAGADPAALIQPDGIHPTAAGVALMVEAIGPSVEALLARADAARGGTGTATAGE
ncbi:arylesterase [Rhodobacterales bacterium HKCCE2091]|nr:arylesterase [Rhodobacterales bacterium HKCCE2091]